MSDSNSSPPLTPSDLIAQLESWRDRLVGVLGDDLVSVAVYGGVAKGEFVPNRSDVNLLVVVRLTDTVLLDRLQPIWAQADREFHGEILLLAENELRCVADVFPIKFLDIQRYHWRLAGRDVLATMTFRREHLRLRCEQELRNLSLRLRNAYMRWRERPEVLETTLVKAASSLLVNLGVVLELSGSGLPATKQQALAAGSKLGLDLRAVEAVVAIKRSEARPDADGLRRLYGEFLAAVDLVVRQADALESEPGTSQT